MSSLKIALSSIILCAGCVAAPVRATEDLPSGSCSWTVRDVAGGCLVETEVLDMVRVKGAPADELHVDQGHSRHKLLCGDHVDECGGPVECVCPPAAAGKASTTKSDKSHDGAY